jgi:hypothetical protein
VIPGLIDSLVSPFGQRVLRTDFTQPGFAREDLGPAGSPQAFRLVLADLMTGLGQYYRNHFHRDLVPWSVSRFEQQASTRPHRDGGPDESVLLLGYEPTEVESEIRILDYSRAAADRNLAPREFLERHNPAFQDGERLLRAYTTQVQGFASRHYLILAINNGLLPLGEHSRGMLGVLHQAIILTPRLAPCRWINSILLAGVEPDSGTGLRPEQIQVFVREGTAAPGG